MMFDLRKFWLGTTLYVLIIGAVIASVCVGFNALIGMPAKETHRQAVTPTESSQGTTGKGMPVEIKREPATSAATPVSPQVRRAPAANIAAAMTPSQIAVPDIKIIVPERRSTKGAGPSRSGF
jgi:hypothetical protein